MGRGEQAINLFFVSIGGRVGEKCVDLRGGWGKTDQVEMQAAKEGGFVCFRGGMNACGFELCEDESIDRVAAPCVVLYGRQWWASGGSESPVAFVSGAFGDPALQQVNLRGG